MDLNKSVEDLLKIVDSSEVTDADISNLRDKMKEIEKVLKEKNKPKTITISGYSHKIVKDYCADSGLNMGEWVSSILVSEVEKSTSNLDAIEKIRRAYKKIYDEFIKRVDMSIDCTGTEKKKIFEDEVYKGIMDLQGSVLEHKTISYKDYVKTETKRLEKKYKVRSARQILNILRCDTLINNENLIPMGYSIVDGYAMYEIFDNIDEISDKLSKTIAKYEIKEMSRISVERQVVSTPFEDLPSFINFKLDDVEDYDFEDSECAISMIGNVDVNIAASLVDFKDVNLWNCKEIPTNKKES